MTPAIRMSIITYIAFLLVVPIQPVNAQPTKKDDGKMNPQQASAFAKLALKGIQKEFPNKPDHVMPDAAGVHRKTCSGAVPVAETQPLKALAPAVVPWKVPPAAGITVGMLLAMTRTRPQGQMSDV